MTGSYATERNEEGELAVFNHEAEYVGCQEASDDARIARRSRL